MSWLLAHGETAAVASKPHLGHLSLDDLIAAYNNDNKRRRGSGGVNALTIEDARKGFESTKNDEISDLFVCKNLGVTGTVLTKGNRIYMRYPSSEVARLQPEFEETLWRARTLANDGYLLLQGTKLRVLLERLQSVIVYLLGVLESQHKEHHKEYRTLLGFVDSQHKAGPSANGRAVAGGDASERRIEAAIRTAQGELRGCEEYLTEATETVGRKFYLLGAVSGLVATTLAAVALAWMPLGSAGPSLAVVAGAGAVGAVISVMMRIYQGNFSVDPRESHLLDTCVGWVRPVVGAVMATAIYLAIVGALLPIRHPVDEPQRSYFLAVFAFVAGFTERWAQDVLVTATTAATPAPGQGDAARHSAPGPAVGTPPDTQLSHLNGIGQSPEGFHRLSAGRTTS